MTTPKRRRTQAEMSARKAALAAAKGTPLSKAIARARLLGADLFALSACGEMDANLAGNMSIYIGDFVGDGEDRIVELARIEQLAARGKAGE